MGHRESVHGITAQCEEFARTVPDVGCQKPAWSCDLGRQARHGREA